ncbi:MAG: AMP-binding protein, partial [Ilumatobacteraceae bacterium]
MPTTALTETLLRIAADRGDRRAIGGADGRWWTWQGITRAIESSGSSLADAGIARGTRVAVVVPDGPLAAMTIWAVACAATAVPIPDASEDEVVRWIGAIDPDAIVTVPERVGVQSWATKHNVPLGLIRTDAEEATLDLNLPRDVTTSIAPEVAIVMLTSGSTGVPKQIPRTDSNVLQ